MSDTCVDPVGCQMTPPNLILLCDFGRRSTDEYMLAAASAMQEMGSIQLVAVIVMGTPQEKCASLVRTTLDSLQRPRRLHGNRDGTECHLFHR